MPPLWHFSPDSPQMGEALPGSWRSRPGRSEPTSPTLAAAQAIPQRTQPHSAAAARAQSKVRVAFRSNCGCIGKIDLSITAIHKVLRQAQVKPLAKPRRITHPKRYSRPLPGDRIQMDTMKIATGLYQYTAIDDCSRFRVLGLYPRRTAKYTIEFLERVIEEMPFSIQRIQTER
jgi:hypothetical protein